MIKSPEEVAQFLSDIYEKQFGGKKRGRYRISRINLRSLSGRKILQEGIVEAVTYRALEDFGLVITDLGDEFSVIEVDVLRNYRAVPKSVLNAFIDAGDEYEANAEDDDE